MSSRLRVGAICGLVALIGLAACSNGQSPSPSAAASVAATPTASATPTVVSDAGGRAPRSPFREVTPNPLAQMGNVADPVAATWSGTVFVIAAHPAAAASPTIVPSSSSWSPQRSRPGAARMYAAPFNPNQPYPPIEFWTSLDGETWSTNREAGAGEPRAYAFDGNTGVAVGWGAHGGAVWTSPDSQSWTQLPEPSALLPSGNEQGLALNRVAYGPAGYVAIGTVRGPDKLTPSGFTLTGSSLVFWSPDGRDWHREPLQPFADASLTDVVAINGRYVISVSDPAATSPTLWTSTDGRAWTKEPALDDGSGNFVHMAAVPGAAILAETDPAACVAWRSSDGLAWTRITDPCLAIPTDSGGSPATSSAGSSGVFVATSPSASCELTFADPNLYFCADDIEVSATGERWASLRSPTESGDVIAASASEVLWSGTKRGADGAGLWIADLETGQ